MGRSHLPYREAGHVYEQDAAGESLGDPRDQIPGGAAEEKKDGLAIRVVGDRPQRLEQLGQPLDFIEDDETFPAAQYPLRRAGQGLADGGPFEIEDGRGARPIRGDLSGEGCLADLPRSEESHHRGLGETLENGSMEVRPADLLLNIQWN